MSAKLTATAAPAAGAAAAVAAAQQAAAASSSSIAYVQCQNLKYNALIIGWLGVIISSVMVFSSMMVIHMQTELDVLIKQLLLSHASEKEQQFLMNRKSKVFSLYIPYIMLDISYTVLTAFSTFAYGLSLINLGVSLLLLIGVGRVSMNIFLYIPRYENIGIIMQGNRTYNTHNFAKNHCILLRNVFFFGTFPPNCFGIKTF